MTREYTCEDCDPLKVYVTDGLRGRPPSRCPEHTRLKIYEAQRARYEKKHGLASEVHE